MKDYIYCPMCKTDLEETFVEGRDRLRCKKCGWIRYNNPGPVVSCLVTNSQGELLLIKRGIEPGKGCWALPGGFIEVGESPEEAGARELFEETGLKGKPARLIGVHSQKSQLYNFVLVIGIEFIVGSSMPSVCDEVEEVKFYPRKNLPKIPFDSNRKLIDEFFSAFHS